MRVAGVVPTDDPRIEWVRSRAVHAALEGFGVPGLRFIMEDLLESGVMDDEVTIENADAKAMADRGLPVQRGRSIASCGGAILARGNTR